jgi:precorrin-2 dehydrogenase/sirohydrochlorin ferrochelatase
MSLYPVNLDIYNQLCVVIGGGVVARRKIEGLLLCRPKIKVISPQVCPEIADFAAQQLIHWEQRVYQTGDLLGAKLVFAATDSPHIQKQVVAEANKSDILVNVITDPELCSFQVPAMFRQDDLLITVATGGGSPALAARIRRELAEYYGPEYGLLLALMKGLRKQIVLSSDDTMQHKRVFDNLLNSDILAMLKEQKWAQLESILLDILPPEIQVSALVEKLKKQEKNRMETLLC